MFENVESNSRRTGVLVTLAIVCAAFALFIIFGTEKHPAPRLAEAPDSSLQIGTLVSVDPRAKFQVRVMGGDGSVLKTFSPVQNAEQTVEVPLRWLRDAVLEVIVFNENNTANAGFQFEYPGDTAKGPTIFIELVHNEGATFPTPCVRINARDKPCALSLPR